MFDPSESFGTTHLQQTVKNACKHAPLDGSGRVGLLFEDVEAKHVKLGDIINLQKTFGSTPFIVTCRDNSTEDMRKFCRNLAPHNQVHLTPANQDNMRLAIVRTAKYLRGKLSSEQVENIYMIAAGDLRQTVVATAIECCGSNRKSIAHKNDAAHTCSQQTELELLRQLLGCKQRMRDNTYNIVQRGVDNASCLKHDAFKMTNRLFDVGAQLIADSEAPNSLENWADACDDMSLADTWGQAGAHQEATELSANAVASRAPALFGNGDRLRSLSQYMRGPPSLYSQAAPRKKRERLLMQLQKAGLAWAARDLDLLEQIWSGGDAAFATFESVARKADLDEADVKDLGIKFGFSSKIVNKFASRHRKPVINSKMNCKRQK